MFVAMSSEAPRQHPIELRSNIVSDSLTTNRTAGGADSTTTLVTDTEQYPGILDIWTYEQLLPQSQAAMTMSFS